MPIDSLFSTLKTSASALTANRRWMDAIAENLANAQTTRTDEGGPYRRKITSFKEVVEQVKVAEPGLRRRLEARTTQDAHMKSHERNSRQRLAVSGVEAQEAEDNSEPRLVYDPGHPDANSEGYVAYPNVEVVREMVDLITASRAYEANVTAINATKSMHKKALEI